MEEHADKIQKQKVTIRQQGRLPTLQLSFVRNGLENNLFNPLTLVPATGGGGGGGGEKTPYNGLYGEAPPERGTFFSLQVYKRVGISQVEVYKRLGKSVI